MPTANDHRIARNSAFLYARMLITMGISLYTSRVVLQTLGIDNYGIYNVVGSVVTIFAFLNGTMAGATQRFLNFEMGRGAAARLRHTFCSSVLIHAGIALLVLILGETLGLWYVNTRLVVAPERLYAANWAFQFSLLACVCSIIQVPYMASVIARERMDAFAIISLANAFLKLGIALALFFVGSLDTLIVYSALMLGVSVITLLCYMVYAHRFPETRFSRDVPRDIVRGLLGFSAADIFGNLCYTLRLQSVSIILNRFGGEALNAAVGLNLTVSGAINQFGMTIISAFRPQIVQQYAAGDLAYMQRLMTNCARYSLLMINLIAIPAVMCMDTLLNLWLVDVPPYTADFCRLTILAGATELIVYTLNCGVHATGRIRLMSVTTGCIYLAEIPLMWMLLHLTGTPWIVYALHLAVMMLIAATVGLILRRQIPAFALGRFALRGVAIPLSVVAAAAAAAAAVYALVSSPWPQLLAVTGASAAVMLSLSWSFILDGDTRRAIISKLKFKARI